MVVQSLCCRNPNPEIEVGSIVHCKRIVHGDIRVGGAERYIVKYLSNEHAIVEVRRLTDLSVICEVHYTRREFDNEYEICPGA